MVSGAFAERGQSLLQGREVGLSAFLDWRPCRVDEARAEPSCTAVLSELATEKMEPLLGATTGQAARSAWSTVPSVSAVSRRVVSTQGIERSWPGHSGGDLEARDTDRFPTTAFACGRGAR